MGFNRYIILYFVSKVNKKYNICTKMCMFHKDVRCNFYQFKNDTKVAN